jgi:1-aminocyclopropane-1-carboxylate deaminase/D-cysteine desulfhydrase-like pyridoxal-dependent ACC family enzyme
MLDDFPRVSLLPGPSPLEPMARAGVHAGHPQLWVKRDDCMPLAFGGNKLRNLEFWLGQALEQNSDLLVIAGAAASNQVRLTAAAAARIGLECLVLYAGPESSPVHANRLLTEMMGASIRHLGEVDETERARLASEAVAELAAAGRRPYLVGDPVIGALGYVRAAQELHDQTVAAGIDLRHIVLPGSMGVTEAGMVLGAAMLDLPWTFHLVSVEYDAEDLKARIRTILADVCRLVDWRPAGDLFRRVKIHMDQLGAGYGIPTYASIEASRLFARLEALVLEQTYVAKTFAGLLTCLERGDIPSHEAACIVHTGGAPSIFS